MCYTRFTQNTGRKNYAKNRHLLSIAQLCRAISSQIRHVSTIGEKMLNGNISCQQISDVSSAYRKDIWKSLFHMSLRYAELTSEICWRVWGTPANFNGFRVFASLYCTDVAQRRSTKLCTMFGRLLHWYTVYVFWGILPAAKFTLRATLAFSKLAALPHGTRALASAKVCGVVQGMELRNFRRRRHATYIRQGGHHVGHRPTF